MVGARGTAGWRDLLASKRSDGPSNAGWAREPSGVQNVVARFRHDSQVYLKEREPVKKFPHNPTMRNIGAPFKRDTTQNSARRYAARPRSSW